MLMLSASYNINIDSGFFKFMICLVAIFDSGLPFHWLGKGRLCEKEARPQTADSGQCWGPTFSRWTLWILQSIPRQKLSAPCQLQQVWIILQHWEQVVWLKEFISVVCWSIQILHITTVYMYRVIFVQCNFGSSSLVKGFALFKGIWFET